jgi:hypothetical protein
MDCSDETGQAPQEPGQYRIRDIFFLTTIVAAVVFCGMAFLGPVYTVALVTWVLLMLVSFRS